MTPIPLSKIIDNPFRDLSLCPLDEQQIAKLAHSIGRHGFFSGVRARPSRDGKRYELGFGHHRIAAARKAGLSKVEIDIRDMSDDEMLRLMASENAIQAGARASVVMNEVAAVVGRFAKPMLMEGGLSQIRESHPEIAKCFQSQHAYEQARRKLEAGDGLGEPVIRSYLGEGDAERSPRDQHQIRDALAAIKASGRYAATINAVRDEIAVDIARAEQDAQQAERDAEHLKQRATTKGQKAKATKAKAKATAARKQSDKAAAAGKSADRAAATTAEKHRQIFDERCAAVFAKDHQLRAFREAVTSKGARDNNGNPFIALDQQLPLAKKILADARSDVSADFIKSAVAAVIADALRTKRDLDEQERQRLIAAQQDQIFMARLDQLNGHIRGVVADAGKLFTFFKEHPEWARDPRLSGIVVRVEAAISMLTALKEVAHGKEIKATLPRITEAAA